MVNAIIHDDCLRAMASLESDSIDACITDPPYGTTSCKWDAVIPFAPMWEQLRRVVKPTGVIALFASQPFTSALVMSNPSMYRHEWIWIKNRGSNFANTVREPMKEHESILVFSRGGWTYNKQMQERTGGGLARSKYTVEFNAQPREGTRQFEGREHHAIAQERVPSSWQKFNVEVGLHPTQKPVELIRYLVRTYTNEGETVLDFAAGSGTTGVACRMENRNYVIIEKDAQHIETISRRLCFPVDEPAQAASER